MHVQCCCFNTRKTDISDPIDTHTYNIPDKNASKLMRTGWLVEAGRAATGRSIVALQFTNTQHSCWRKKECMAAHFSMFTEQRHQYRQFYATVGYLSFGPMAQCVVHALKGLACRARVTPASSPASHCKQCSALPSPSLHARGCASPSRAR